MALTDLDLLLINLNPALSGEEFAFCTVPGADLAPHLGLNPLGAFIEDEGLTLILWPEAAQRAGLAVGPVMRRITLTVHSALEAVGLTAAVSSELARHGISANMIAAYHHDHIFVPAPDAERALDILKALQQHAAG